MTADPIAAFVRSAPPEGGAFEVVCLANVRPERVEWLWPGRIPRGKLTILDGDPGVGKTTLTADLAARVSQGDSMPGETSGRSPAGVLLVSAEDGVADTLRPRVEAAGADLYRVHALPQHEAVPLDLGDPAHLDYLRAAIREHEVALVVIDPLMAYLGTAESHKDQDVRRVLGPLSRFAEEEGVTILAVRHLNKSGGGNALYRGGGSIGITAAARSVLLVARDPDDDSRRILAVSKCNLSAPVPALAFRIVTENETARVAWEGATEHTTAQLLAAPRPDDEPGALDEAVGFLREALARGPMLSAALDREARAAGVSERTLKRARKELRLHAHKDGPSGAWTTYLPGECWRCRASGEHSPPS